MYSRYLDEKSLVGNRRTGGKGGEEGSGEYFEDFWEEESELGLGKKGFRNFQANDIAAWISIESAQLRCSPVT